MAETTINAFENTEELRHKQRVRDAGDVVRVVNLGYEEGTRLFFAQEIFKMPAKGESFAVPRKHAQNLIRSHRSGALAMPHQVAAVKAASEGSLQVPPGFAVVSDEDAALLEEIRAQKALEAQQASVDTTAETQEILDEID